MVKNGIQSVKCEWCNKIQNNDRVTRTTDRKTCCLHCFDKARDYYKKGLLSSDEVSEYYSLKAKYYKLMNELILKIKKVLYEKSNLRVKKEIEDLYKTESQWCIKKHNKVREVLNLKERIGMIEDLINYYPLLINVNDSYYNNISISDSPRTVRLVVEKYYYNI